MTLSLLSVTAYPELELRPLLSTGLRPACPPPADSSMGSNTHFRILARPRHVTIDT
jgi:hypothetical protein